MGRCILFVGMLALLVAASVYGCSSNEPGPPPEVSGSSGSSSGTLGTSCGGSLTGDAACTGDNSCSGLLACGPRIYYRCLTGTLPTPAGGAIAAGTYVLTGLDYYNGPQTDWLREKFVLIGSSARDGGAAGDGGGAGQTFAVDDVLDHTGIPQSTGGVLTTSGTTFTWETGCPSTSGPILQAGYTATPTTLVLIVPLERTVFTYTKQ